MKVKSSKHSKVSLAAEGVSSDFVLFVLLLEVNPDFSSVNYFCLKSSDERPTASVCVCVFLCTSRSILSVADARTTGGREEGSCVCMCVWQWLCVCVCLRWDSLQRKLDMCRITRDTDDRWLVWVWRLRQWCHQHKPMALKPAKNEIFKGTEGAFDFTTGTPVKDSSKVRAVCLSDPHCGTYIWVWERNGTFGDWPELF